MTTTQHGSVTFYTSYIAAANQAVLDTQLYANELATQPGPVAVSGELVAAIAGAIATSASAGATAGSAGVGIAGLVKDSDGNPSLDAIEIEIVNSTSQPLITVGCKTASCSATEIVQTLLPTATDSFLMTGNSNGRFSNSTNFQIGFVIGGSPSTTIQLGVKFSYTTDTGNPGRWVVSTEIDGTSQSFPKNLQLFGAQFLGSASYPSFSMYVSPIETSSGKMTLNFFDTAS